jgi:hypothetical protein
MQFDSNLKAATRFKVSAVQLPTVNCQITAGGIFSSWCRIHIKMFVLLRNGSFFVPPVPLRGSQEALFADICT